MKIGIIGAMEQEVDHLRQQIVNLREERHAGCVFYSGSLHGVEVVLTQSGIGKVAAAIAATLLIERYQPTHVINTGSAGGFDPELNVGDVVISTEVRHHDVDLTVFGYEIGQVPGNPPAFVSDEALVTLAEESMHVLPEIRTRKGLICTGDIFLADPEAVEKARRNFPGMLAGEMEAAAIAQACHQFQVPFVVVRALSDIAGKESHTSFEAFLVQAAKHSSEMILEMLRRLSLGA